MNSFAWPFHYGGLSANNAAYGEAVTVTTVAPAAAESMSRSKWAAVLALTWLVLFCLSCRQFLQP